MVENKIRITYVDAAVLKPSEYNPRTWDEVLLAKLTDSICHFGLVDPLIVNSAESRKNVIIGGHFRFEVARRLNIKKIPVVYVNIPDINKEKELNLRLNRNTGEWDYDLLKSFDIEMLLDIGFDDSDLSIIWEENLSAEDDEFDTEKELSLIKEIKTKPGDIIKLGDHILGCGDSTDTAFVNRIAGSLQANMVYLDPPYNISLNYNTGIGTNGKYGGTYTKDNKTYDQYRQFLTDSIKNALMVAKKDSHIFCYCDESYIGMLQKIYYSLGIDFKRVCLWIKNNQNVTPQIAFNKAYEPCIYGTIGSPYLSDNLKNLTEILNKEIDTGNRTIDDILDLFNIWLAKRLATSSYEHPTEKPPTLHEKPIRRCTKIGDIIIDLFGGSGSTLIACQQLKRRCVTCEIEPIFCDLIISRYKSLTGREAEYVQ
ncbi:MAG: DNA modification methylase [Actinobacteria bacterium]|nr:DNA modification methylase [Actinomycetota bacterium]